MRSGVLLNISGMCDTYYNYKEKMQLFRAVGSPQEYDEKSPIENIDVAGLSSCGC